MGLRCRRIRTSACLAALLVAPLGAPLGAQELTPRAYWPAPKGTSLLGLGYGFSTGDVLVDPSLPVVDVDTESHGLSISFLQFFDLAGRTATWSIELPAAQSTFEGNVEAITTSRRVTGFADLKLRLAVNLLGTPSMSPAEFQAFRAKPQSALGASLRIQAPTGKYNPNRVTNLGTSRWAFKPELGYLLPLASHSGGRWVVEAALGVWIYGDNEDFLGRKLEQAPLVSSELHLVRRQRAGFWLSLDLNGYYGGRTKLDNVRKDNKQKNSRIGFTVAYPLSRRHLLKLAVSTNLTTESGGDYDAALLAYQFVVN